MRVVVVGGVANERRLRAAGREYAARVANLDGGYATWLAGQG